MNRKNFNYIFYFLLLIIAAACGNKKDSSASGQRNVILITLDGMRWQDLFRGADSTIINDKQYTSDSAFVMSNFWSDNTEERRAKLFPFLWGTVATKGQIYGNRDLGSKVNVTNRMWFSYPGYNELLTGAANDSAIFSNDAIDNPRKTLLELLNDQPAYKGGIAAFTSWDAFPGIINSNRSGLLVNSGIAPYQAEKLTDKQELLNEMITELPYLGSTRPDAITFNLGFEYLKVNKPSVLFMSFDETDHFAHGGDYALYLKSARHTDQMIASLWNWLQNQEKYKDNTTLIITVDHGRGAAAQGMWQHHGIKVPGADEIWFAVIGPDTAPLGERKQEEQLYQNQIAQTIASLTGFEYKPDSHKPGEAIKSVIR